ncbi:MAG TPA: AAA family ATPase [Phycisphaerae bacterium]|nr:AAA family ATPase [Phycisphaerae bacterium]
MYKEYFNLREEPFNVTPDPRFLYMTAQHAEAFNHLLYGIRQRKGFICLTGEVGAGKTTLCRALLNELGPSFHTALILNPMLTGTQLLRAILTEFGVHTKRLDRLGYLNELNRFLLSVNSAGRDAVLIIDEAQDMSHETLELTRLLSNLETDRQKLLQIVLVGQPELRKKLSRPALRQLAQRITVRYHLGTMSPDDTAQYIRHRLTVAAAPPPAEQLVCFEDAAIHEIHRRSGGTPRLVNCLGDKALLAGYVHRTGRIDRRLVRLAAAELREAC